MNPAIVSLHDTCLAATGNDVFTSLPDVGYMLDERFSSSHVSAFIFYSISHVYVFSSNFYCSISIIFIVQGGKCHARSLAMNYQNKLYVLLWQLPMNVIDIVVFLCHIFGYEQSINKHTHIYIYI
jgi:hypothetical protein